MSRTLLIRGGAIGDFILTLPVLEALKASDPSGEIEVLGYPDIVEMVLGRGLAHGVRRVSAPEWAALFAPDGELADQERDYLTGFDRVVCVWPDHDSVIRDNLLRAGVKELRVMDPLPPTGQSLHAVEYVARQCVATGLPASSPEPRLYPSEKDRWWGERFMRVTLAGERPLLAIHPGSGSGKKNWPASSFEAVAQDWLDRRSGHVLVVAGPADSVPLEALDALLGDERVFLMRNESLPRLAAVLERCEVFVGNDSGVTHIAAAVRIPVVALFGPTDPDVWRPLGPRVNVLRPAAGSEAVSDIPVESVVRQVDRHLGQ